MQSTVVYRYYLSSNVLRWLLESQQDKQDGFPVKRSQADTY